jgi:hypothetical protein
MVIYTAGTTTPRAPKDGTSASSKGKASGGKSAPRKFGPPTAAEHSAAKLAFWPPLSVSPPLSAPGATIYDQHGDASHNATTRPDLPEGNHPGDMCSRRLHPCRAIRCRRGSHAVRVLRRLRLARQEGCVNELSPMGNLGH